ncbi:cation channel sperm-associated protein subunit epsilon [Nannospalax galili]|uniref:cation channel sperm-associated protein subunit epsilon n=1 Tax=Nannospalax galili TaxID=1026970 RepID=UPI0004ED18F0|nr:cation channel sperm-associated protein subunit epsilon [Nannospalax galili]
MQGEEGADVTIWVFDPEKADIDELLWNAETPSLNSQILSKQLATLGQHPTIHTVLKRKTYLPDTILMEGTWVIRLPMTSEDLLKEIKGNQVAFQDCFIANLPFLLTFPMLTMPEIPQYLPLTLPAGSPLMTTWSACVPSFALVISELETFQTNDSFRTWVAVRVPPNVLSDADRHSVEAVSLLKTRIIFLIKGTLYLKTPSTFKKLESSTGLPVGRILGISRRRWCWIKYFSKTFRSWDNSLPLLLYWNKFMKGGSSSRRKIMLRDLHKKVFYHTNRREARRLSKYISKHGLLNEKRKSMMAVWTKDEFFLGYSSLKFVKIVDTKSLKTRIKFPLSNDLTIQYVEYTGHPQELALLLSHCVTCTTTKQMYIVIYNEDLMTWTFQDFKLSVSINTTLTPRFLHSALPELILWDKHRIYYCYQNFTQIGVIQTSTGQDDLSLLSDGSNIHDILLDYQGSILVKMENNVMFFSKISISDVIKLHQWSNETVPSTVLFSEAAQIYIIYFFDNFTVKTHEYPLFLEIKSVTYKTKDRCPYMAFHNNVFSSFNFLDKGESLTVWAQIVYPENLGLYIIVEQYGPNILTRTQSTNYEIALGYCTKSVETKFSQNVDYNLADDYFDLQEKNTGLVLVHLRPSEFSKMCPLAKKVFQIAVGCDVNKYIVVDGFSKEGCQRRDFSYVIDKAYLRNQPSKNLKVRYDWGRYGCPLRLEFKQKFKPIIQLFDDNGFIKDVEANFIVWEIHGRNDYSFNTTMKQNGCVNEAQTWESMRQLNKSLSLEDVWGPQNYRTCFSYAVGKPGDLNQPYEILNSTGNNHLIWPTDHSGMYVFHVRILDPNFSFCDLTATFAIETFGVIPRPSAYLVIAFLFVLLLLFISILVLSYFWYMKIYRQLIKEPLHKPPNKQKKY